jgi:hypothetical protein
VRRDAEQERQDDLSIEEALAQGKISLEKVSQGPGSRVVPLMTVDEFLKRKAARTADPFASGDAGPGGEETLPPADAGTDNSGERDAMRAELGAWERKVRNRMREGRGFEPPFEATALSEEIQRYVRTGLSMAETQEDVIDCFLVARDLFLDN